MIKKLRYLCTLLLIAVASAAWGDEVTFDATVDVTENAASYQTTEKAFTASDGSVWKANGYGATANTNIIIGKGGANYLETPEVNGVISSVTVTWSGNTSYYLALQTTSGTELAAEKNTSDPQTKTFNVEGSYSQLRLVGRRSSGTSNAAATITKVVVSYTTTSLIDNDLTLSASTLSLDLGTTSSAQITNSGQANGVITWTSSNPAVATVDASGNVTAVEIGTTTITAEQAASDTYKGGSATCLVTVDDSRFSKSDLTFTAACGGTGVSDDGMNWNVSSDAIESVYDSNSGIHYGTSNAKVTYIQLSSNDYLGTIKKVLVNARDAQENATISVTVGGTSFTCTTNPAATNVSSDYVFTGSAEGEIIVRITRSASMEKALYVKRVVVYYVPSEDPQLIASDVTLPYDATSGSITFDITNPVEGAVVTASTESDWLTLGTIGETVPFTCTINEANSARTATVTLTYTYNTDQVITKDVTVTQAAAPTIYSSIPALFNAASTTETEVKVTFDNWVVSGVSTNGKNVFVTDNNGSGFVIYSSTDMSSIYSVGDILSGSAVSCNLVLYNGFAEIKGLNAEDLTITDGGDVNVVSIAMANLSGVNTGALVSYKDLTCSVTTSNDKTYYYLSDGTTTLQVYNSLYDFDALEDGEKYNITGVYQQYKTTTKEILPRSSTDIVLIKDNRADAEISFTPETLIFTQGDEYEAPTFNNPHNVTVTFSTTNADVASWDATNGLVFGTATGTAIITATFEGNETYKPATATLVVTVKENLNFVEVVEGCGIYQKITSADELEAGKHYLIVGYKASETAYYAYNGFDKEDTSKKYGLAVDVIVENDRIDNSESVATPVVLQKYGDNWFIMDGDNFLAYNLPVGTTKNNNLFSVSDAFADGTIADGIIWNIDFESESGYLINNVFNTERSLEFNSDRFACYKGSEQDVVLYKELGELSAYAVVVKNEEEKPVSVTFYYDDQKANRGGENISIVDITNGSTEKEVWNPMWQNRPSGEQNVTLTTVTFDKSFQDFDGLTSLYCWFACCTNLVSITGLEYVNTSNVATMSRLFYNCQALTSIDVRNFNTSKVINMSAMFYNCLALSSINVGNFNTEKVTNMSSLFSGCTQLTNLDLSNFNTANVKDMSAMFFSCGQLKTLTLGENFKTAAVTNMGHMFYHCDMLEEIDLSTFDTSKVTNMEMMFSYCKSLTELDLSNFNTAIVTNLQNMFYYCSGLTTLDVSKFSTANVTNMSQMFTGCPRLTSIYVGEGWNTENVPESQTMFGNCVALVGGAGTTFDATAAIDKTRAILDGGVAAPGYLTYKTAPSAPTFNPVGGEYSEAQTVAISAAEGTKIYYTTDGSQPSAQNADQVYTEPVTISQTATLKAIAVKGAISEAAEATYTIAVSTQKGDVNGDTKVDIADVTELVNALKNGEEPAAGDIDGQNGVNVDDVRALVEIILSNQ